MGRKIPCCHPTCHAMHDHSNGTIKDTSLRFCRILRKWKGFLLYLLSPSADSLKDYKNRSFHQCIYTYSCYLSLLYTYFHNYARFFFRILTTISYSFFSCSIIFFPSSKEPALNSSVIGSTEHIMLSKPKFVTTPFKV